METTTVESCPDCRHPRRRATELRRAGDGWRCDCGTVLYALRPSTEPVFGGPVRRPIITAWKRDGSGWTAYCGLCRERLTGEGATITEAAPPMADAHAGSCPKLKVQTIYAI